MSSDSNISDQGEQRGSQVKSKPESKTSQTRPLGPFTAHPTNVGATQKKTPDKKKTREVHTPEYEAALVLLVGPYERDERLCPLLEHILRVHARSHGFVCYPSNATGGAASQCGASSRVAAEDCTERSRRFDARFSLFRPTHPLVCVSES